MLITLQCSTLVGLTFWLRLRSARPLSITSVADAFGRAWAPPLTGFPESVVVRARTERYVHTQSCHIWQVPRRRLLLPSYPLGDIVHLNSADRSIGMDYLLYRFQQKKEIDNLVKNSMRYRAA